jgi:O-methyltransferase involved in polyketide biosynthesis
MTTTYTPGLLSQSLLGAKADALDTTVDDLFKNSAGPSQVAFTALPPTVVKGTKAGSTKSSKADAAARAREAVEKAKSITEIISEKKKEKKVSKFLQSDPLMKTFYQL